MALWSLSRGVAGSGPGRHPEPADSGDSPSGTGDGDTILVLTCFAAKNLGVAVRGVIINNYPDKPDRAEESAPHLIDSLAGAPLLGVFPHCPGQDSQASYHSLRRGLQPIRRQGSCCGKSAYHPATS